MPSEFKIGDIVEWSDVIRPMLGHLHQGPFIIKSNQNRYWRIHGLRSPIGPKGCDYYLVSNAQIQHNAFLNAVTKAVEHG